MGVWRDAFSDLAGRGALVTGGSTGIGAALCLALADCGMAVAIHCNASRDAAEVLRARITAAAGTAIVVQGDVAADGVAAAVVEEAAARLGRLDLLVNNAGSILGRVPTTEVTPAFYRQVIDLNLNAVFASCQAAIPLMRRQGGGAIINTTSLAARMGGGPGTIGYAAAKAGVATMTRGLARELAPDNIRVNAVAPGFIQTPLHDRHTDPKMLEDFLPSIPLGRIGAPDDCVGAYLFLASERLAGYVTGQTLEVNGGILMP